MVTRHEAEIYLGPQFIEELERDRDELLAALERIVGLNAHGKDLVALQWGFQEAKSIARAAIAKATGA